MAVRITYEPLTNPTQQLSQARSSLPAVMAKRARWLEFRDNRRIGEGKNVAVFRANGRWYAVVSFRNGPHSKHSEHIILHEWLPLLRRRGNASSIADFALYTELQPCEVCLDALRSLVRLAKERPNFRRTAFGKRQQAPQRGRLRRLTDQDRSIGFTLQQVSYSYRYPSSSHKSDMVAMYAAWRRKGEREAWEKAFDESRLPTIDLDHRNV